MTLQDTLIGLFVNKFKLLIKKEYQGARITIVDTNTNLSHSMILPLNKIDLHLEETINYCSNKLIQKLKR